MKAGASYRPSRLAVWLLELLSRLPLRVLALFGSVIGALACAVDRRRRHIVQRNLELCFPELPAASRRRLMRRQFRALGRCALCSLAIAWWSTEERLRRCVRFRGRRHYLNALQAGRPVILLAPHFVNLEIGWLRLAMERPMVGMYREPRGHFVHWAAHRHRQRFGDVAIERGAHLKSLIRLMREGRPFYYLPDIDAGKETPHVFAPFFGVPAATLTAPSRIARMTKAVVIPCVTRECAWGRYEIEFFSPLAHFQDHEPLAGATRLNKVIETAVRAMPEQYFWIHRRFKTRPRGMPRRYHKTL